MRDDNRSICLARRARRSISLLLAALVAVSAAPASMADDASPLAHDLATGSDFRVRVEAALSLGKTHSASALAPLVGALDDAHPAVRAAAAAALAALGRREAADALRAHLAREPAPSVQSQLRAALERLTSAEAETSGTTAARPRPARYLVKVGQLRNLTAVRGPQVADLFRGATRARAAELPGVELLGEGIEGASEAERRKLPLLVLDGVVNRLAPGARGERLTVSAQVEYTFRKIPEHALRGTISGAAQAEGGAAAPLVKDKMAELEQQALCGAVESAMRGAPQVLLAALRQ